MRVGYKDGLLTHKLGRKNVRTMAKLMEIANDYAFGDEALHAQQASSKPSPDEPRPSGVKDENERLWCSNKNRKRKNDDPDVDLITAECGGQRKGGGPSQKQKHLWQPKGKPRRNTYDEIMNSSCSYHYPNGGPNANHTNREYIFHKKRTSKLAKSGDDEPGDEHDLPNNGRGGGGGAGAAAQGGQDFPQNVRKKRQHDFLWLRVQEGSEYHIVRDIHNGTRRPPVPGLV